jgi:hypothetical protein
MSDMDIQALIAELDATLRKFAAMTALPGDTETNVEYGIRYGDGMNRDV